MEVDFRIDWSLVDRRIHFVYVFWLSCVDGGDSLCDGLEAFKVRRNANESLAQVNDNDRRY